MAVRTTSAAVLGILTPADATISLTPFIEVANSVVNDVCLNSGYDATKLELIERWLAAHFFRIRDKAEGSEQAGSVLRSFQFKLGLNLAVTMYGQQAMVVDFKGNLAALSKRMELGIAVPSVTWLGTGNSAGDDIST